MDKKDKDKIIKCYKENNSVKAIAKIFDCSTSTVYNILKTAGLKKWSVKQDVDFYYRMKHGRLSYREIAEIASEHYSVGTTTMFDAIKDYTNELEKEKEN